MLALAHAGGKEGDWLYADSQSAGKGRQGRAWLSPPGNLYTSGLVRIRENDPPAPSLALVAGVALHRALSQIAPDAPFQLKWPNDVLVQGAKLAGILLEREGDAVVIGIGVNLTHAPMGLDRPVVSLNALHAMPLTPRNVLDTLATAFAAALAAWRANGLAALIDAWTQCAHPIGTPLQSGDIRGTFAGLDASGALCLRLADGTISVIHAGDVFLV